MLAQGAHTVGILDVHEALGEPVTVHLREQERDRVVELLGLPLRDVLEHVPGRHLEPVFTLGIAGLLANEAVVLVHVFTRLRDPDHGVDRAAGQCVAERAHSSSLNTRAALSWRNFGHTWSRKGTWGSSSKMRSRVRPMGK